MDNATLKDMWGVLALRGMLSILFGLAAVFWPGLTLATLLYLFAIFIVASGLANMVMGLTNLGGASDTFWGRILLLILGIAELGVGVYLIRHPLLTFGTFILIVGGILIVRGLFDLFAGIFSGGSAMYKIAMIFGGILAGLAGVVMFMQPAAGGIAFVWILGLYALITGPLLLALAFDVKKSAQPSVATVKQHA